MFGSSWGSVLGACRTGAEWAWRQVYEDVAPSLLRYHRARGTPDPEDLVGDTFVRVVRGLEGNEEQFRAWVFTISRRRPNRNVAAWVSRLDQADQDPLVYQTSPQQ